MKPICTTAKPPHLLDVLTARELGVIMRVLSRQSRELQRSHRDWLRYAAEHDSEPDRAQFYLDCATADAKEIDEIGAVIRALDEKLTR